MGLSGTQPGALPAAIETAHRASVGAIRWVVVQRQGAHVAELGRYQAKGVANAALEEMVAKGFPRDELDVRRIKHRAP